MQNSSLGTHCKIALRWMPQNLTDERELFLVLLGVLWDYSITSILPNGIYKGSFSWGRIWPIKYTPHRGALYLAAGFMVCDHWSCLWVTLECTTWPGSISWSVECVLTQNLTKIPSPLFEILAVQSQWIFAHAMTAVLSWHVQNFIVIE